MKVLRWLMVAVTLLAVLGMHTLMGPDAAMDHSDGVTTERGHVMAQSVLSSLAPETECSSGVCQGRDGNEPGGGHTMAHLCLAVLAGVVALLSAAPHGGPGVVSALIRQRLAAFGRMRWLAPPWTQPSLAQLSVLRV